jgi:hypothetical protein
MPMHTLQQQKKKLLFSISNYSSLYCKPIFLYILNKFIEKKNIRLDLQQLINFLKSTIKYILLMH